MSPDTTPLYSGSCVGLYGLLQGLLLCSLWYDLQAARNFSIKIFLDFEIEIDFDRGTISKINVFFLFVWLIFPNRGGGYTSRSRGGVSAENSDKNKKALF